MNHAESLLFFVRHMFLHILDQVGLQIVNLFQAEQARRRAEVPDLPKGRNQDREKFSLQDGE